jgi:hypothetical protein
MAEVSQLWTMISHTVIASTLTHSSSFFFYTITYDKAMAQELTASGDILPAVSLPELLC